MSNVITAKPVHLPVYQDRPVPRPVEAIAGGDGELRDTSQQTSSTYVYRGELLEAVANHPHYRPRSNQQVDPQYRHAIDSYQRVASTPTRLGQILDGTI